MIDVLIVGGIHREVLDGDSNPRPRYGGSGLTSAIAAARLGVRVALVSYVGSEDEEAVRTELRIAGVDDRAVVTVDGASGTFVFPTTENADRPWPLYRPAENVPAQFPSNLPPATVALAFGMPDCDPVSAGLLDTLTSEVSLLWDRQGWLSRARDSAAVRTLRPSRKIYLANQREAMDDAQTDRFDDALAAQPPPGFEIAVIKCGMNGVVVIERLGDAKSIHSVPSFPTVAASTIGTGDVFAGAFAAQLAQGALPTEASRCGCAAAAVALRSQTNLLGNEAQDAVRRLLSLL